MRCVVVGGFEPSGHDSRVEAVRAAGEDRGHEVAVHSWGPQLEIDHPIFHVHRLAGTSSPSLIGVLDDPRLAQAIARDFGPTLRSVDADVVIAAHPWAAWLCAERAQRGAFPPVVNLHGEFEPGPIPLLWRPEIDMHVGVVQKASSPPRVQRITHSTGVPVRAPFSAQPSDRTVRNGIAVSSGIGGWAESKTFDLLRSSFSTFPDSVRLNVIGHLSPEMSRLAGEFGVDAVAHSKAEEIAEALRASSVLVTKASGSNVAEALACRTHLICASSGVFWEDAARGHVIAEGLASREPTANQTDHARVEQAGEICRMASERIWGLVEQLVEEGIAPHDDIDNVLPVAAQLRELNSAPRYERQMPASTAALFDALADWV